MSQIRLYARHLSSRGPCTLEFLISQFGGWGGAGVVGITPAPCKCGREGGVSPECHRLLLTGHYGFASSGHVVMSQGREIWCPLG